MLVLLAAHAFGDTPSDPPKAPAPGASTPASKPPEQSPFFIWLLVRKESSEETSPGLGEMHRYTTQSGWADVFIYDAGNKNWSEGIADTRFSNHFNSVLAEVRLYEAQGAYRHVKMLESGDLDIEDQRFRYQVMEYLYGDEPVDSVVLLTVRNGELLKYRLTLYRKFEQNIGRVVGSFVRMTLRQSTPAHPK